MTLWTVVYAFYGRLEKVTSQKESKQTYKQYIKARECSSFHEAQQRDTSNIE